MDYIKMAERLYTLVFDYDNSIYKIQEEVSVKGEDCLLLWLYHSNMPLFSGDLAKKLSLTSGRIANILRALEVKNYISRSTDSTDGRKVLVTLTPTGKKYIEKIYKKNVERRAGLLEKLGEDDAKEYLRIMEKAFRILNED